MRTTFTPQVIALLRAYKLMMGFPDNSEAVESCIADSIRWRLLYYCASTGREVSKCFEIASALTNSEVYLAMSRLTAMDYLIRLAEVRAGAGGEV